MRAKWIGLMLAACTLASACSSAPTTPSANAVQTAIAQTAQAAPTSTVVPPTQTPAPTQTPIPPTPISSPTVHVRTITETAIEVGEVALKPGDLPFGFGMGQITSKLPSAFASQSGSRPNPPPIGVLNIGIAGDRRREGDVTLVLYRTPELAREAFLGITQYDGRYLPTGNFGENGVTRNKLSTSALDDGLGGLPLGTTPSNGATEAIFVRCLVVVRIYLQGQGAEPPTNAAGNYAIALDSRLAPIVCDK